MTIIGGDLRYGYCARCLRQAGWTVDTFQVQGSPDTRSAQELFSAGHIFLLPYPAFTQKGYIPFLQGETILHCNDLLAHCSRRTVIVCGRAGEFGRQLQNAGATVIDYERDAFLTAANAVPTAEGALQIALEQMPQTLWGTPCLVTGFGRVGKLLAARLHRLGAQVTVAARKQSDQALISAFGIRHDTLPQYRQPLSHYRLIVNTVPAPIFTPEQYEQIDPECVLIDLASSPGGIDASQCLKHRLNFTHARGLPGKVAPATAGRLIAEAVQRAFEGKELP